MLLRTAASGEIRSNHWVKNPVTSIWERTTLLEAAATNLFADSEDVTTLTNVRSTDSAAAITAPDNTLTGSKLIEDSTASNSHYAYESISKAASSLVYSYSVFLQAAERVQARVIMRQGTVPGDGGVTGKIINLDTGVLSGTFTDFGSGWTVGFDTLQDVGGGWYRYLISATSDTDTICRVDLHLADSDTTSYSGDGSSGIYIWGWQLEQGIPTSYIPTSGATDTRAADSLSVPFTAVPQEMTVYARFFEGGNIAGLANFGTVHVGAANGTTDPRFHIKSDASGFYEVLHDNGTDSRSATLAAAPSLGDLVELRGILNTDGSVKLGQSINGATETVTATTAGATLQAAWAGELLYVNSLGSSNTGTGALTHVRAWPGILTLAQCRTLAGTEG